MGGFLGLSISSREAKGYAKEDSARRSLGNWKKEFDERTLEIIDPIIHQPMSKLGYYKGTTFSSSSNEIVAFKLNPQK